MVGDLADRLAEGGEVVADPAGLRDVVEADDAERLGDVEAEFQPRHVHEAERQQVGGAEHAVRPAGGAEQLAGAFRAGRVAGRPGTADLRFEAELGGSGDEGLLARHDARRARRRADHGKAPAAGPVQHEAGLARRALIVHQHDLRPLDRVVAVDEDDALAVLDAGLDQRDGRRAGHHHRGVGAVVQRLAQRRLDIVRLAGRVQHHDHLADRLQLARGDLHHIGVEGRLQLRHDHADDAGPVMDQPARQVVDVVAELFRRREHLGARRRRNAGPVGEGARDGRARDARELGHANGADRGLFRPGPGCRHVFLPPVAFVHTCAYSSPCAKPQRDEFPRKSAKSRDRSAIPTIGPAPDFARLCKQLSADRRAAREPESVFRVMAA
ncbi:protein of unknown function (plasmid) [Shinella sp. WSC3-e]|nr:hypothetical protein SHINE37_30229 [Rhizobiaceae bacterium]CAK7261459.1 protein of unknown function [Shinella sp. WSC3-e]